LRSATCRYESERGSWHELGFGQQPLFIAKNERRHGQDDQRRCQAQANRRRRRHIRECLAKGVGGKAVAYDPGSGRGRAGEIEIPLRHGIRSGKHGRHVAQKRQKASNENEPAAVSHEEPLPDPDPPLSHPQTGAIPHQKLMPESLADPKAGDLAEDGRNDRARDQRPNVQAMISGGEKCGRDQSSLGRQRNPHAFERDERHDDPDTVVGYELSHFVSPRRGLPAPILGRLLVTRTRTSTVELEASCEFLRV
jgi:hypothetical protein